MCTYTKISAAKVLLFFDICKREGDFVRFLSLGHRSVGKRQRMGGYKQGQGIHKTVSNEQKVMMAVIYINLTRTYINFCFLKALIFQ
jgi:hypothetical protein